MSDKFSKEQNTKAMQTPSYGAIVFCGKKVLMIRSGVGWSFPKGHAKTGETPVQTAMREVREETGIRCEIIGDVSYTVSSARKEERRSVTFFLAQYVSGTLCPQLSEVFEAAWKTAQTAADFITYAPDKEMYLAAYEEWSKMI